MKKLTLVTVVCLFALSCARTDQGGTAPGKGPGAPATTIAGAPANLRFDLVNFSGANLRAVYLSPGDSSGWEENLLGTDNLDDGATIDIRVSSNEAPALWDLKVVGTSGYYAEWKGLDLRGASRVTLAINLINVPTVVAEIE